MDHNRYDGTVFRYTVGDPTVLGADLALLETLMQEEDSQKQGALGVNAASENRAQQKGGRRTRGCRSKPPAPTL